MISLFLSIVKFQKAKYIFLTISFRSTFVYNHIKLAGINKHTFTTVIKFADVLAINLFTLFKKLNLVKFIPAFQVYHIHVNSF